MNIYIIIVFNDSFEDFFLFPDYLSNYFFLLPT